MSKLKNAFIAFFVFMPVIIALRAIQLLYMIEPETGFAQKENILGGELGVTLISVMYFGILFALYLLSRLSGGWPASLNKKNRPIGVISILLSIANALELYRIIDQRLAETNRVIQCLLLLSAVASSAYFLIYGLSCFKKVVFPPLMALCPVAFHVFLLVATFMKYTALANVGENSYDIACLCLMLVFSLQYAKMTLDYNFFKASRTIYGIGLASASCAVLITIPRYIIILLDKGSALHSTLTLSMYILLYAVFEVVFLSVNMKQPSNSSKRKKHEKAYDDTEDYPDLGKDYL